MILASPIWLLALLPWAGLAAWMLLGRHRAARVPFIELWRGAVERPRASRQFTPPPLSLVAVLACVLLAILAAARPVVRTASAPAKITVVVDRGITMSAAGRRAEVIDAVKRTGLAAMTQATLVTVPESTVARWGDVVNAPDTCADTSAELNRAVATALAQGDDAVVVLGDQVVRQGPRVIQIAPTRAVANVSIVRFAVREVAGAKPQAMVTVRNDSSLERAELSVDGVKLAIDLPSRGQERNYFVDLPALSAKTQATIDVADDFDGDNRAYLARQHDAPAIEMRGNLAPEVRRVVEAYKAARPALREGAIVAVVAYSDQLKDDHLGIVAPLANSKVEKSLTVHPHPISANLDASRWGDSMSAKPPGGDGWSAVISAGEIPLVLVREHPARQVWIGLTSPALARSTDFVVLWTNALDWVSGAGATESFSSEEVGRLPPEWKTESGRELWPGFYRRSDGATLAANAPAARFQTSPSTPDWQNRLAALSGSRPGGIELAPYLAAMAIACALLAACLWPGGSTRRILTAFSNPRTV